MVDPIVLNNSAYDLFLNGSIMQSSYAPYTSLIGDWFWVLILLFLLIITYIRTEDVSYVFVYALLGTVSMSTFLLFPAFFKATVVIIMGVSLGITLYAFFVRQR